MRLDLTKIWVESIYSVYEECVLKIRESIVMNSIEQKEMQMNGSNTLKKVNFQHKTRVNRFAKTEKCHQLIHATLKIDFSHFVAINQFMASIDRFMRQKIRILHILTASIDS
jgi:hypothetical protein